MLIFLDVRKLVSFHEPLALTCQVNISHTVSRCDICWWNLCCFVAKSVCSQFMLYCRETCFVAIYAFSVWGQITS